MAYEGKLGEALDELDALGGFRVFMHLPGDASDAGALASALPWVVDGAPRPGTTVRVFARKSGVAVVTGGNLSEADLEGLLAIRSSISDVLQTLWVLPPSGSPASAFAALGARGLFPGEPPKPSYHPWAVRAVAIGAFILASQLARLGRRAGTSTFGYIALLFAALGLGLLLWSFIWQSKRDIEEENPSVLVAQRWYPLTLMRG